MIWRILLLAFAIVSCGPSAPSTDPVVVLMCTDLDSDLNVQNYPCCTGFFFGNQVVTANHCVPGDTAELVTGWQWAHTSNQSEVGTVTARDPVRDIAWLSAALDGPGLAQGGPVTEGQPVRALTRSGAKSGLVGATTGAFRLSSMDTRMGDSGSAVVDQAGAAVGVVSRCLTGDGKQCDPGSAIFAELP